MARMLKVGESTWIALDKIEYIEIRREHRADPKLGQIYSLHIATTNTNARHEEFDTVDEAEKRKDEIMRMIEGDQGENIPSIIKVGGCPLVIDEIKYVKLKSAPLGVQVETSNQIAWEEFETVEEAAQRMEEIIHILSPGIKQLLQVGVDGIYIRVQRDCKEFIRKYNSMQPAFYQEKMVKEPA